MRKVTKTSISIDELLKRFVELESNHSGLLQSYAQAMMEIRRLEQQLDHMHLLDAKLEELMEIIELMNKPPK